MTRRSAFTLVELLTTLAVLSVLLAILLPVIGSARAAAMKVVCTTRLRDLALACSMYRAREHSYPLQPGAAGSLGLPTVNVGLPLPVGVLPPPRPTDMDVAFLNALQPYLPFSRIDPADAPSDLPPLLQCPTVEDADDEARVLPVEITLTRPALYTGYAYCVRPRNTSATSLVKLLKPDRVAQPRFPGRAVVWADDVHWSLQDLAWSFAHVSRRAEPGPTQLTYANHTALLGQHLAYSDGSVEWVSGSEIDLDISVRGSAASKASLSVFDLFYYWF